MNRTVLLDKYPVYAEEIAKGDTECKTVETLWPGWRRRSRPIP